MDQVGEWVKFTLQGTGLGTSWLRKIFGNKQQIDANTDTNTNTNTNTDRITRKVEEGTGLGTGWLRKGSGVVCACVQNLRCAYIPICGANLGLG